MKPAEYLKAVLSDASAAKRDRPAPGYLSTAELVAPLGVHYIGSANGIVAELEARGICHSITNYRGRRFHRLNPPFKTWPEAVAYARRQRIEKVPKGWVSLMQLARELKRTVRGLQYVVDRAWLTYKTYRTPRATRHYRRADMLRALGIKDP